MVTKRDGGSRAESFRIHTDTYLDDFGTSVTLIKKTETKDSMGRTTAVSETNSTIQADVQWVTKKDLDHVNMGDVKIGDGMIYVKHSADISLEDEFSYKDKRWRIVTQVEGEEVTGEVDYQAYVIRANDQT